MLSGWRSFHLYYHHERDLMVRRLLRPTVRRLLRDRLVESFYFVRYGLGGPHLRLRLRVAPGGAGPVREAVFAAAARFFARHPSPRPLPDEEVRRVNRELLSTDADEDGEAGDEVCPDNSAAELPASFEVDRFGGAALLGHSLDYFALSSLHALAAGTAGRGASRLGRALQTLTWQAWGFAADGDELLALAGYPEAYWGERWSSAAAAGDRAFERRGDELRGSLHGELEALAAGSGGPRPRTLASLAGGAAGLSRRLDGMAPAARLEVAASHLHMTANRIGLTNPEEVYLGRLLGRAAGAIATSRPDAWRDLWAARDRFPPADLAALRRRGCTRFAAR